MIQKLMFLSIILIAFSQAGQKSMVVDNSGCVQPGWLSSAVDQIRESEYEPSIQKTDARGFLFERPRLHYTNRAQNLRAYFDENGLELQSRETNLYDWRLIVDIKDQDEKMPYIENNTICFNLNGMDIEYLNSECGLVQNVIIYDYQALDENRSLKIDFIAQDLFFEAFENSKIIFRSSDQKIEYAITGINNAGESIILSCNFQKGQLIIEFRDIGDRFPVRITALISSAGLSSLTGNKDLSVDGLSNSADWYVESDQASSYMGYQVNTAGDVNGDGYSDVIIGVSYYDNGQSNEGRTYVYHGSAIGLSATPNWTVESEQANAYFGISVASAGDVNGDGYCDVIIGATYYDNGNLNEGMAFVYHGSISGLSGSANWTGEPDQDNARYSYGVASAGDVNGDGYSDIVVGAPGYSNGQSSEGRAFVYHGSSSGLSTTPDWTAEGDLTSALYGCYVATAGDVNGDGYSDAIVGARQYADGQANEGRAFVYHGSSGGLSSGADWYVESDQINAQMGNCVSSAGDVNGDGYSDVLVGAYLYDNTETDEGRINLYYGSSSGLSSSPDWTDEADQDSAWFGWVAGCAGDVNGDGFADIIIGAPYYDNGQINEGYAWVYYGSVSGLASSADWTNECNQDSARFGVFVSSAGDVNGDGYSDVLISADWYDNDQTDEGRVFAYYGHADGIADSSCWNTVGGHGADWYGISVSDAGDVNGDGYADVIVGAYGYDNGQTNEGLAFVFHGSATGLSSSADWTGESDQDNAEYGISVSGAGDINGDGYSDVIVGAHKYDNGSNDEGRAFVYHGSATGLSSSANWTGESDQDLARYGYSVSTGGDVNGDGYSDVVIGAPYYDNGESEEGRAYVYHGSISGLPGSANWTAEGNQTDAYYGISVSDAGDVNGDGYSDVIIGASRYSNVYTYEGRAFVYHGSSSGLSGTANWTKDGEQDWAAFGNSVCTAGDINGDGYSDVIVGVRGYSNQESNEGRAYVYNGSASGLSTTASWFDDECDQAYAYFGQSVHTAGDVNGDGFSDVLVGASNYDNGRDDEGIVYCYFGSLSGLSLSPDWSKESDSLYAIYGYSVSTAGDVNGDGYSDILIGAPAYIASDWDEGAAFVYFGNDGDGVNLLPRQATPDGVKHIQLLNALNYSGLGVKMRGYTPAGRGKVKVEWQVRRFGLPFDDLVDGQSADWYDTGVSGVEIKEEAYMLNMNQVYKWRARLLYSPLNYLGATHSRWVSYGPNGWNEADFRNTETIDAEEARFEPITVHNFLAVPNISSRQFKISFDVTSAIEFSLFNVYDICGRLVKTLHMGALACGHHEFYWSGKDNQARTVSYGVYFVRFESDAQTQAEKLLLIK